MPISRKRRPRRSARKRQKTKPTTRPRQVQEVSLRSLLDTPPDRADLDCIVRALEAGRQGDAAASLKHELSGAVLLESRHRFAMQDLVDQGDDAPPWAYSRWCGDLAYRSMLMDADPRTDEAVFMVMGALYLDAAEGATDAAELRRLGTRIAAGDDLAQDIAVYELGGLSDYVQDRAASGLLERTDRILGWAHEARVGAYEVAGLRGCRLVLCDLSDGREVEVLNIGALAGVHAPALVGRLAPISAEPGLMFARRPFPVDLETASLVGEAVADGDPFSWLSALALARDGGLAEGFHLTPTTPYTSDLPYPEYGEGEGDPEPDSPRAAELCARGHAPLVANALGVLEVSLIAAQVGDVAAAGVSPHVMAALAVPGVFEAARIECVAPGSADAWRVLAAVVPEHGAGRLLELAAQADARRGTATS